MGRIKSLMVKRAARQLLEGNNSFNATFDNNKKILGSLMPSKPIRNKIAGYLTRLIKMRENPKVKKPLEMPLQTG